MLTTTKFGFKKPDAAGGDTRADVYNAIRDNADLAEAKLDDRFYAEVLTAQTTSAAGPTNLATDGPSVTLTVPTNGLVAVFASVLINMNGVAQSGLVTLDDGGSNLGQILSVTNGSGVTQITLPGSTTGVTFGGSWLLLPLSAGAHTLKLRYGTTSGATGTFSNRKLWARVFAPTR